MSKQEAQELIEGHYMGALDAAESARLEELLLDDESLRNDFREAAALDSALRDAALTPSEATAPTPKAFPTQWIAIAAAAIVLLGSLPFLLPNKQDTPGPQPIAAAPEQPIPVGKTLEQRISELIPMPPISDSVLESEVATIESFTGAVTTTPHEGETRAAVVGQILRNGATVKTSRGSGTATLRLWDGSQLDMATGTSLTITKQDGQFRLFQPEGQITASVEPQQSDKPLTIETPSALVTVLGTRFTLISAPTNDAATSGAASRFKLTSRLFVEEGRVAISNKTKTETVEVEAQETVYVEDGVKLEVQSTKDLVAKVEILQATYSCDSESLDLTDAVRSRVRSSRLLVLGPFNLLDRDPCQDTVKTLRIDFRVNNGHEISQVFEEWENRKKGRMKTEITLPLPE